MRACVRDRERVCVCLGVKDRERVKELFDERDRKECILLVLFVTMCVCVKECLRVPESV